MANLVFNVAKGRVVEFYNRVESEDPSTSGLVLCLFTGAGTDTTLKRLDTLAAIEADGGFAESVDGAYARKVLTDVELAALPAPDDTGDKFDIDLPDQTWGGGMTGESITRLIVCYAPDTGGADSTFIPLTAHDFAVTTDGTDVLAQVDAAGFFSAG